jgi:hypothetical protein
MKTYNKLSFILYDLNLNIKLILALLFFPITFLLFFIREWKNGSIQVFKDNFLFYLFILTIWFSFAFVTFISIYLLIA